MSRILAALSDRRFVGRAMYMPVGELIVRGDCTSKRSGAFSPRAANRRSRVAAVTCLSCVCAVYVCAPAHGAGRDGAGGSRPRGITVVDETCTLRPAGTRRANLVAQALRERDAFATGDQADPAAAALTSRIASYWGGVPRNDEDTKDWIKKVRQEWKDAPATARAEHWSAVFTSWLMCRAGFSMAEFRRAIGHRFYIDHALNAATAAHRVRDAATTLPRPGDLVCADASPRPRVRSIADYRVRRPSSIHCHVVISADATRVQVVGGNVEGQVKMTEFKPVQETEGLGLPWSADRRSGWAWFAVLSLQSGRD